MIQNRILRRLVAGSYVLPFCAFLLGLARHSYRAKELLVCWLLFCSFFAVLALIILGAVLACQAGHYLVRWVRAAYIVIPELVAGLAQPPQEDISGPRILVADTQESVHGLGTHAALLIKIRPTTKDRVRN